MSGSTMPPYGPPQSSMRVGRGLVGWLIFVMVAAAIFATLRRPAQPINTIALSDFYHQIKTGNIAEAMINDDSISGELRTPVTLGNQSLKQFRVYVPPGASQVLLKDLLEQSPSTIVRADRTNTVFNNFIAPFIPWLLILGFIWFFVFRRTRANSVLRPPIPVIIVNPEQQ